MIESRPKDAQRRVPVGNVLVSVICRVPPVAIREPQGMSPNIPQKLTPLLTLSAGLGLLAVSGFLYVFLPPWYRLPFPGPLVFDIALPVGFGLSVIGCLTIPYAQSSIGFRARHAVAIGAGLVMIVFGTLAMGPFVAVLALGTLVLLAGCYPWVFRLPSYVTLPIGVLVLVIARLARVYVPIVLVPWPPQGPDDAAGGTIHSIETSVGLLGIVLTFAGLARCLVSMWQVVRRST